MDVELVGGISAVLLIVGLVQLVKQTLPLPSRYTGLLAVGLGVVLSLAWTFFREREIFRAVVVGLALGLSASGLWSTGKHIYRGDG